LFVDAAPEAVLLSTSALSLGHALEKKGEKKTLLLFVDAALDALLFSTAALYWDRITKKGGGKGKGENRKNGKKKNKRRGGNKWH